MSIKIENENDNVIEKNITEIAIKNIDLEDIKSRDIKKYMELRAKGEKENGNEY